MGFIDGETFETLKVHAEKAGTSGALTIEK